MATSEKCIHDIADDNLKDIFKKLKDPRDLESLSMVCQRFKTNSNHSRTHVSIVGPTVSGNRTISSLVERFPKIQSVDMSNYYDGDLDLHTLLLGLEPWRDLEEINVSMAAQIPMEALHQLSNTLRNTLKVLRCSKVAELHHANMVQIAAWFPCLEEVDFSQIGKCTFPTFDEAIESFATGFKKIKKMNLSRNDYPTDQLLKSLSLNCKLESLKVEKCPNITAAGLRTLLSNSANLKTIFFSNIELDDWVYSAAPLDEIAMLDCQLSNNFFFAMPSAAKNLTKLHIVACTNFRPSVVYSVLEGLKKLRTFTFSPQVIVQDPWFNSKNWWSCHLYNLVELQLSNCFITNSAFYNLVESSPLLKSFYVSSPLLKSFYVVVPRTGIEDHSVARRTSKSILFLTISYDNFISFECIMSIIKACPNVERLELSNCGRLTDKRLEDILKICTGLKYLNVSHTSITSLGHGPELHAMKTLQTAECCERSI